VKPHLSPRGDSVTTLIDFQRRLLERDMILAVNAEALMPRIGGYNARPYSKELDLYEPPRSSEIKALWRWWMRVILSGIYGGRKNYIELDEKVSKILGSTRGQTSFSVIIDLDPNTYQKALEIVRERVKLYKRLLLQLLPEALKEFVVKWDTLNFKNMADLSDIKLSVQISIRLKLKHDRFYNQLKQAFERTFGISLRYRQYKQEAEASIEGSGELLKFMEKLNVISGIDKKGLEEAYDALVRVAKIPRIRILLQPRGDEGEENIFKKGLSEGNRRYLKRIVEDIAPLAALTYIERVPFRVILTANRRLTDSEYKFAVATFLLSLILGGIGSITGRGFGSIAIKDVHLNKKYENLIEDIVKKVREILECENKDELKNKLNNYINYVFNLAEEVYGISKNHKLHNELSKVPTLVIVSDRFRLEVVRCRYENIDLVKLLEIIGSTTLKLEWKKEIGVNPKSAGGDLHTWILGLPRQARGDYRYYGYFVRIDNYDDPGRRVSAIRLKVFENIKGTRFVIIYGFLSRDWPIEKLVHKSKHYKKGKNVRELGLRSLSSSCYGQAESMRDEEFLRCVFNTAFDFVYSITKKCCEGDGRVEL
jgi:CRISPR type III-B/RAMP module RAMP protein Cmr1